MGSVTAEDFNAAKRSPDEAEFQRLAELSRVDYDRERKAAAKKLNITLPTLDIEVAERRPVIVGDGENQSIRSCDSRWNYSRWHRHPAVHG